MIVIDERPSLAPLRGLIPVLPIVMVLANALDAVTFAIAFDRFGLAQELNPVARALVVTFGLTGVMVVKAAVIAYALFAIGACLRAGRERPAIAVMSFGAAVGTIGFASNLLALA